MLFLKFNTGCKKKTSVMKKQKENGVLYSVDMTTKFDKTCERKKICTFFCVFL